MRSTMRSCILCFAVLLASALGDNCFDNCTHYVISNGYLTNGTWVGNNWSAIQTLLSRLPAVGPIPGLDANASTMRTLTLNGDYDADVPLQLPSRLHLRLNGTVTGGALPANYSDNCSSGRCSLILVGKGISFVSVTGGRFTCTESGDYAFAI